MRLLTRNKIAALTLLALLLMSCSIAHRFFKGQYLVTSLDAGNSRKVRILADRSWEYSQAFYYEVEDHKQIIVPVFFIGAGEDDGNLQFKLLYSKDKDVIGLVEEHSSTILYALHDFAADKSWPNEGVGSTLKAKLQQDNVDRELILNSEASGTVKRKLY